MNITYKIGLIGYGSIGKRHFENIQTILNRRGIQYSIDLIRHSHKDVDSPVGVSNVYTEASEVPNDYDVIFVTNPTHLHFETLKQYIDKATHFFIEKPVFNSSDVNLDTLALKPQSTYYVACPLRYSETIQHLKKHLKDLPIISLRAICSSYLPDWRVGDYRQTYSARKGQGGGVSIDLIHEWDYLIYLFGMPEKVLNLRGRYSPLEIDSEDLSVYIADYRTFIAEVHLDYFGKKATREIQIMTHDSSLVYDLQNSELRNVLTGEVHYFDKDRNAFYLKELAYFFDIVEGKALNNNSIYDAINTLRIAEGR